MLSEDMLLKLQQRQVELLEVFLDESDPKTWPTLETKEGRGDAHWLKKNAGATATLVVKIQSVLQYDLTPRGALPPVPEGEAEDEINESKLEEEMMGEARDILARVGKKLDNPKGKTKK